MAPCLSFIIPAFNEARFIDACLGSIRSVCSKQGIEAEIIVVDNGSEDNTGELARQYTDQVLRVERGSVSFARNYGVSKSKHALIAFIDGDVELTDTWGRTFVENYQNYADSLNCLLTGAQYSVRKEGTWVERNWFANAKDKLLNGGNILTSREVFDKIQGFDEGLKTGEDYDFCERAIGQGANLVKDPQLDAIHLGFPREVGHFVKREIWHGEGDFKSFGHFVRSPVAIIAIFYLLVQIGVILSLFTGEILFGGALIAGLVVFNFLLTLKRFSGLGMRATAINSILNYLYFCARAVSLFKALKNRNKKY